jgi:hypothetical protein
MWFLHCVRILVGKNMVMKISQRTGDMEMINCNNHEIRSVESSKELGHKIRCGRNNSQICCRRCCSGASGAGWARLVSVSSTCLTVSVAVMAWSGEHRAYIVETYLKNAESVIATQWLVWTHFRLGRNATVPDRKTILLWVANFRATGSALKKKLPRRPRTVRSPQNVQAVRQAITQSPWCSARKHAAAIGMSEWSEENFTRRP